ncbi:MAG: hypothetical protein ACK4ON_10130, partial [Bacteroidia bacterium]
VQKIFPECVGIDDDGYLNLNIHAILVAYVNAIREQHELIENLQKQINEKENNYKVLIEKQHDLENQIDVLISQIKSVLELQNTSNK